jgi:hypothetical protein
VGNALPGQTLYLYAVRRRALRYILLAMVLLFKETRHGEDESIDELLAAGLVSRKEVALLADFPRKGQVVIGWLFSLIINVQEQVHGGYDKFFLSPVSLEMFKLRACYGEAQSERRPSPQPAPAARSRSPQPQPSAARSAASLPPPRAPSPAPQCT